MSQQESFLFKNIAKHEEKNDLFEFLKKSILNR